MQAWLDALLTVLIAPLCAACNSPLRYPTRGCVCPECWAAINRFVGPVCNACGGPTPDSSVCAACRSCLTGAVDGTRSVGSYEGALRAIVHAFKYEGRRSLARPLSQLMRTAGADLIRSAHVAVPVPLHPARRRERGFNQAADLAERIGPPVVHALARVRHTPTQTALNAEERRANVVDAFRGTPSAGDLSGATVLIVDDVRTTGATLDACGRVLKTAGARQVFAITAARVETSRL